MPCVSETSSSILKGVRTLVGLAELGRPVSAGVAAVALDIPPSTAHRILLALKQSGYAAQDPATGAYSPGAAFLGAATAFGAASSFPEAVRAALVAMTEQTNESAFYGAFLSEMRRVRFLAQVFSDHAVQYVGRVDRDHSLLWGASGRAIAAFLPESDVLEVYEREKSLAEGRDPLPSWSAFRQSMAEVRALGYCMTINQRSEGVYSIAAPVFGSDRAPIGCVGIAVPSSRCDEPRIAGLSRDVIGASARLSELASSVTGGDR